MSSLGVYSVDHEMSQIRAAFCVVLLLGGALGVAQTVLVLGCRYSWTISNYREVTWRVVIPRLTRVSRLSEIQSIASGLSSCFSLQNDTMLTIVT